MLCRIRIMEIPWVQNRFHPSFNWNIFIWLFYDILARINWCKHLFSYLVLYWFISIWCVCRDIETPCILFATINGIIVYLLQCSIISVHCDCYVVSMYSATQSYSSSSSFWSIANASIISSLSIAAKESFYWF